MDLILPATARHQPLEQCAGLLLLGEGFTPKAEFLALAPTTAARLTALAPFSTVVRGAPNQGKLVILADATTGTDLGVTAAVAAAPRALG